MVDFNQKLNRENSTIVVLAGGFGTRLKDVLNGSPKPLANVNGRPFISYILKKWIEKGYRNFIFSLHYQALEIVNYLKNDPSFNECHFEFIIEPVAYGTGGAISYINSIIELPEKFIVINADTWVESDFESLDKFDQNVMMLVSINDSSRYGFVEIDENNLIVKFSEKSTSTSGLINCGIYKLEKSLFQNWKGNNFSLEKDLFPELIAAKTILGNVIISRFIDIGVPEDYYKFCDLNK